MGQKIPSSGSDLCLPPPPPLSNTCTFFPPQAANQSFHHYTNLSQSCQYSNRPCRGSQDSHCHSGLCPHMSAHALSVPIQDQNLALNIGGNKDSSLKDKHYCMFYFQTRFTIWFFFSACVCLVYFKKFIKRFKLAVFLIAVFKMNAFIGCWKICAPKWRSSTANIWSQSYLSRLCISSLVERVTPLLQDQCLF